VNGPLGNKDIMRGFGEAIEKIAAMNPKKLPRPSLGPNPSKEMDDVRRTHGPKANRSEVPKEAMEKTAIKFKTALKGLGAMGLVGAGGVGALTVAGNLRQAKVDQPLLDAMKNTPMKDLVGAGPKGMGAHMKTWHQKTYGPIGEK